MSLFIKIATQAQTDARLMAAGPEAAWCWVRGLLYAKEHLTDGYVPQALVPLVTMGAADSQAVVQRLLDAGLWLKAEGGYTVGVERWARHQTTSEQVEESREKNRERQAAFRQRQRVMRGEDKDPSSSTSDATEDDAQPGEYEAGEPSAASASSSPEHQEVGTTPSFSWGPSAAASVTDVSRERNGVTAQPEYIAQSTEHRVKNYTHTARDAASHSREPSAAGNVAKLDGLAREIVHAYPTSRAVSMDPLELPPEQVAVVEGAILREATKAGCDLELAGAQLLVWTQEFAAMVAEWPPGEAAFVPSLRKFFREYQYRDLGRFKRGTDRNGKGNGRAAGPSAAAERQQRSHDAIRGAIERRYGARRTGGTGGEVGDADGEAAGELSRPGADRPGFGHAARGPGGNRPGARDGGAGSSDRAAPAILEVPAVPSGPGRAGAGGAETPARAA